MYNRALEEIEEQKNQINQQEHAINEIKRAERKAIEDAYMANQKGTLNKYGISWRIMENHGKSWRTVAHHGIS